MSGRVEGNRADLDGKAGNREPGARPDRKHHRLGNGARLSPRRESRAVARSPRNLLPAPAKVRRVEHHAALPYSEIGAFMAELRKGARRHRSSRSRIRDTDRSTNRRSHRRPLGWINLGERLTILAEREGPQRTPGAAITGSAGNYQANG
jgi:hypothetical protein